MIENLNDSQNICVKESVSNNFMFNLDKLVLIIRQLNIFKFKAFSSKTLKVKALTVEQFYELERL